MTALDSVPVALADQISATPDCVSLRLTSDHMSPPPVTVERWPAAPLGPSPATNAMMTSLALGVVSAGEVSVPLACRKTFWSTLIVAGGGAVLSTLTITDVATPLLPAASIASAVSVCWPGAAIRVSHDIWNGGDVMGAPRVAPSSLNWTLVTATLSDAVAASGTIPVTVALAAGSVILTCGALVSAGGGGGGAGGEPASTSTVARFQPSFAGAVSSMLTAVPALAVGAARDCTQKVSPAPVSIHWCTSACPAPGARATARSQSLPTPHTHEPAAVVVEAELWRSRRGPSGRGYPHTGGAAERDDRQRLVVAALRRR